MLEMRGITGVVHCGMAVVNLEEPCPAQLHQFLGRDRPVKIRVIDVRKHRLPRAQPLRQHGIHIFLHRVAGITAGERRDKIPQVGCVEVNRDCVLAAPVAPGLARTEE
jgi:hypothetical protein